MNKIHLTDIQLAEHQPDEVIEQVSTHRLAHHVLARARRWEGHPWAPRTAAYVRQALGVASGRAYDCNRPQLLALRRFVEDQIAKEGLAHARRRPA